MENTDVDVSNGRYGQMLRFQTEGTDVEVSNGRYRC